MSWARSIFGSRSVTTAPKSVPRSLKEKEDWSLPDAFVQQMKLPLERQAVLPNTSQPSLGLDALHVSTPSTVALDRFLAEYKPGCSPRRLFSLLEDAWAVDPVLSLKIIFHARSISQGLGWKEGFYRAMGWLWSRSPSTVLANLPLLVNSICETRDKDGEVVWRSHGTWKDLTDLLILHLNDQFSDAYVRRFDALDETLGPRSQRRVFKADRLDPTPRHNGDKYGVMSHLGKQPRHGFRDRLWSSNSKNQRHGYLRERITEALADVGPFHALYLTVLDLYVRQLQADLELLKRHKEFLSLPASQREEYGAAHSPFLSKISLAAKWAPTPQHAVDKQTFLSTALAIRFFPSVNVSQARHQLRTNILSPLREALGVLERRLQKKDTIDYTLLSEATLRQNAESLLTHNAPAFSRFALGRHRGTDERHLLPYHLIQGAISDDKLEKVTAELEWDTLLQRMKQRMPVTFLGTVIVPDLSGSMGSLLSKGRNQGIEPIHHAIGLYLLLSQLSPILHRTAYLPTKFSRKASSDGPIGSLRERIHSARTNKHAVLRVGDVLEATPPQSSTRTSWHDSIRTIMVLTNKEPDLVFGSAHLSEALARHRLRFSTVDGPCPELVWWNLRHQTPEVTEQSMDGFKLISGWNDDFIAKLLGLHLSASNGADAARLFLPFGQAHMLLHLHDSESYCPANTLASRRASYWVFWMVAGGGNVRFDGSARISLRCFEQNPKCCSHGVCSHNCWTVSRKPDDERVVPIGVCVTGYEGKLLHAFAA